MTSMISRFLLFDMSKHVWHGTHRHTAKWLYLLFTFIALHFSSKTLIKVRFRKRFAAK